MVGKKHHPHLKSLDFPGYLWMLQKLCVDLNLFPKVRPKSQRSVPGLLPNWLDTAPILLVRLAVSPALVKLLRG